MACDKNGHVCKLFGPNLATGPLLGPLKWIALDCVWKASCRYVLTGSYSSAYTTLIQNQDQIFILRFENEWMRLNLMNLNK